MVKRTTWTANDIHIYENYSELYLRNNKQKITGKVKLDIEDINLVKNYKWSISSGYARTTINGKTIRMHRLLLNPKNNKVIDHINHDCLDNRKKNLREITPNKNKKNNLPKMFPRIFDHRKK